MGEQASKAAIGLDWAQDRVRAFHELFQHPIGTMPHRLSADRAETRARWMQEELEEFLKSTTLVGQSDAMIDLIYFALGTLVEMGVKSESLFEVVHTANMSKLGPHGVARLADDGKIEKHEAWESPERRLSEALIRGATPYPSLSVTINNPIAAALEMVANALGVTAEKTAQKIQVCGKALPIHTQGALIADDFISFDVLDESSFHATLSEALETYRCVAVGSDSITLYRGLSSGARLVLMIRVSGPDVLVVDPGSQDDPLKLVNLDDLFVSMRVCQDGIHRFRIKT